MTIRLVNCESVSFMAEIASVADIRFTMAIHTAFHRNRFFFEHDFAFSDCAVTLLAIGFLRQMRAMAKPDPIRIFINSHPGYSFFFLVIFREFFNRRFFYGDIGMTAHTFGGRWKSHLFAGFRVDVTARTFQPLRDVQFVTERQRRSEEHTS